MGRKNKERKSSSSEDDEAEEGGSSKSGESSSSSTESGDTPSPKRRKNQREKVDKERTNREANKDGKSTERSRWESPNRRKRKHSPPDHNQHQQKEQFVREERRKGHRARQEGNEGRTKWDRNDREREGEKSNGDKRKKEESEDVGRRRRDREIPEVRERQVRNDNRENRAEDRFEGRRQNERKSPPRREERNRGGYEERNRGGYEERNRGGFDERDGGNRNKRGRGGNDRGGRRGGRENRFRNNNASWSEFDGSKMKSEPSPEWGRAEAKKENDGKPAEKEKPNFEPSGKLTEDANTVNGVVIKYTEPLEARKPKRRWRLYPFKGEKALPTLYVHRQSAFLMGRDRKVADIPLDHPSCSKQHAALQFRLVPFQREDGGEGKRVRPYLIDLESANGTFVNDVKLEARRYHELMERDVLRFGFSSREYVLLHEQSKDDALDDDVPPPAPVPEVNTCKKLAKISPYMVALINR